MVPELIYDGDCGFCTRCARWIEGRWAPGAARAVAAATRTDGELRAVGLTRVDVEDAAWWIDADGTAHRGERAIAAALGESRGWPRWAGRALTRVPLRWLAPIAYRTVARHRHRLPGATSACAPGSRIA